MNMQDCVASSKCNPCLLWWLSLDYVCRSVYVSEFWRGDAQMWIRLVQRKDDFLIQSRWPNHCRKWQVGSMSRPNFFKYFTCKTTWLVPYACLARCDYQCWITYVVLSMFPCFWGGLSNARPILAYNLASWTTVDRNEVDSRSRPHFCKLKTCKTTWLLPCALLTHCEYQWSLQASFCQWFCVLEGGRTNADTFDPAQGRFSHTISPVEAL